MSRQPIPNWAILTLVTGAVILPVAIAVIWGVSLLLGGMQDEGGAVVVRYVALVCGVFWALDLICLVLAVGLNSLSDSNRRE